MKRKDLAVGSDQYTFLLNSDERRNYCLVSKTSDTWEETTYGSAIPAVTLSQTHSNDPTDDVDVIVIGAGWAGMAAADHLSRANIKFLVLESSDRTGGRTKAIEFGDASVGKYVFEQVRKIVWGCNGVSVSTEDGRTFKGKHVNSTVSLGVIRKHHSTLFSPPLPKKQTQALMNNHMPMCNLSHVLIQGEDFTETSPSP